MQRSLRAHDDTPRLHARSAGCCLSRQLGAAHPDELVLGPGKLGENEIRFREMWYRYFTEFEGVLYHSTGFTPLYSHVDEAKVSVELLYFQSVGVSAAPGSYAGERESQCDSAVKRAPTAL